MKKISVFFGCLITAVCINAQAPAIQWQKALGGSNYDVGSSAKQTFDSGYIVAGYVFSNDGDVSGTHGNGDYWIVKLDHTGAIEWQKALGGSDDDGASSIEQTSDSGYVIAGYSASNDGDVTGNHGSYDCWVVKLNSVGDIQWQKSLGGSNYEDANYIKQTSDGGYIIAANSQSFDGDATNNHGGKDYWIVKLDGTGNIQWQNSLGGSGYDQAHSVDQTSGGGYIVAGYSYSNDGDVSGNHGGVDFWIVKLNSSGILVWQKSLGGTKSDNGYSVCETSDGGYITAGVTSSTDGDITSNHGNDDSWIVKLDNAGAVQWQKTLGGSNYDETFYIKQTSDAGYITAGYSYSSDGDVAANNGIVDYWLVKLNNIGSIQWEKSIGGSTLDNAHSIEPTFDSGYIISGVTYSSDKDVSGFHGVADYWIVKLAPDALLPVSFLRFSGEVNGKQNLLHWTTTIEQNNTGFEVQHSSTGGSGNGFSKIGFVKTAAINGNSTLHVDYDYADFGYTKGANYYRLKQIDKDGKFSYSNIVVLDNENAPATALITAYPNPAKNILNVKIASPVTGKITLLITDLSGTVVLNKATNAGTGETIVQLDISYLPAGSYFIQLIYANWLKSKGTRFIKQ